MSFRQMIVAASLVWALLATAGAAQAHWYAVGRDSVDAVPASNRELRYRDFTRYDDALAHARNAWNELNTSSNVTLRKVSSGATLQVFDYYDDARGAYAGFYQYRGDRVDHIWLNEYWLEKAGPDGRGLIGWEGERAVLAHEFGHALGIRHNAKERKDADKTQLMEPCAGCKDLARGDPRPTTPQSHDSSDYWTRWP